MPKWWLTVVLAIGCGLVWAGETWDLAPVSTGKVDITEKEIAGWQGAPPVKIRAAGFFMPMPDKTRLYTILAAPVANPRGKRCPILFIRSCYERPRPPDMEELCKWNQEFFSRGYAVVIQHCRGTGLSEGYFTPYLAERADGLHTLKMLRKLPVYNKEIVLFGQSYLASVHYAYLSAAPEDIKGAIFQVQGLNRYNFTFRNGVLRPSFMTWRFRRPLPGTERKPAFTLDSYRMLPLSDLTRAAFGKPEESIDIILRSSRFTDPHWQTPAGGSEYRKALTNYQFPILLVGGWYDVYADEYSRMWQSLAPEQRKRTAMIMTPYDHSRVVRYYEKRHPVKFENGCLEEAWPDFRVAFFEHCLGRKETLPFIRMGQLTYYSLWEKKWFTAPALPEGPEKITLHLGDHTLQKKPSSGAIEFVYNPYNPATFAGGCNFRMGGMAVQDKPDSRYDIVSFLSEPFDRPHRVRGKITAKLQVQTDCDDTAFYLRLSIVKKNGVAYSLREDICNISSQHKAYRPHTPVTLNYSFVEHAFMLEKGDRLRLDVSSSCWPTFLPHTNLKGDRFFHRTARVARNTIVFAGSSITLPCMP